MSELIIIGYDDHAVAQQAHDLTYAEFGDLHRISTCEQQTTV